MTRPFAKHLPSRLPPDEAAAYWFARIVADTMDDEAEAQFGAWKNASPVNAEAFDKAAAVWNTFNNADAEPRLATIRESALTARPAPRRFLWLGAGAAFAASLLAVFHLGPIIMEGDRGRLIRVAPDDGARHQAAAGVAPTSLDFLTAKGEQRKIVLADGSRVTLNTDSAFRVNFEQGRRLVTLLRGQALFEVAKEPSRPFIVRAGDRQITALGTIFDVRIDPNRTQVTLVRGKVRVDRLMSDDPGDPETPTFLNSGYTLIAEKGIGQTLAKADVDRNLLWRDGFVEFDDTPLSEAVEEMNRYTTVQLVLDGAEAGKLSVSGIFRTDNPERFVEILGELLPLRFHRRSDGNIEIVKDCRKNPESPDCGKFS